MDRPPVLLVAYLYPPYNYAGAARPHRFAKYLERMGHRVVVLSAGTGNRPEVTGNVHRVRGEFEFTPRKDRRALLETAAQRLFFPSDPGSTWAVRAMLHGARILRDLPRPIILTTTPPGMSPQAAVWLARRSGAVWIADFRDPFVGFRKSRRNRWLDPRIERAIFHHAGAVIANTEGAAEIWRARYPEMGERIHTIWNGFDPEDAPGPESLPARDYAVLTHVGEVYGRRDPGLVLGSAERLIRSGRLDPARLRINFTGVLERSALQDPAPFDRLQAMGCVTVTPRVDQAEARRVMSTADYLLLLDLFTELPPVQVPSKTFEYVCIGRPILASARRNSALIDVLNKSGIPHVVLHDDDSPAALDAKLLRFLSLPTNPVPMSREFRETFDGSCQAGMLAGLIESLARGVGAPADAAGDRGDRRRRSAGRQGAMAGLKSFRR